MVLLRLFLFGIATFAALNLHTNARADHGPDTIWIIYNHGSSGKDGKKDCWPILGLPKWVKQFRGRKLQVKIDSKVRHLTVRVSWFCSDKLFNDFRFVKKGDQNHADCPGLPTVCVRAFLIANEVDRIASLSGVDRRLIFIAGQSAGGWAGMLIKAWDPNRFNGVIATSPNFFGGRSHRFCRTKDCVLSEDPIIRQSDLTARRRFDVRRRHEEQLANMRYDPTFARPVLLFAIHCDAHNYPWEYPFARDYTGTLDGFPGNHRAAKILVYPNNMKFEVRIWGAGENRPADSDNRICAPVKEKTTGRITKERHVTKKYFNGRIRYVCQKPAQTERGDKFQYCGRKRIAYCKDNDPKAEIRSETCSKTAHNGFYRDAAFAKYAHDAVRNFLVERIERWRPTNTPLKLGYPCDFIPFERGTDVKRCPKRVHSDLRYMNTDRNPARELSR